MVVAPEVPVTKTITYTVYADRDYTGTFYNNTQGRLQLTIATITKDGASTQVLWDTVYSWRKLADYPLFQNRTIIQKAFPILNSKEILHVSFIRKYNFNGALSETAVGQPVSDGDTTINHNVTM